MSAVKTEGTEALALTRREKKHEARKAVQYALRCAMNGTVRANGDVDDVHAKCMHIIHHYGFSCFPLDRRDVALAIQWLHARKVVRVRHYGPEFERSHLVTLLRA